MDVDEIAAVRRFNRTVTRQVGALEDRYMGRDRPLGEARLLWEIGAGGRDVRELRAVLDLDSGYLSRLLRALEASGLVTVVASPEDRRVRMARLTRAGRAETRVLDRRSDELASSILEPLTDRQRARLVTAMAETERLLAVGEVRIDVVDPDDPGARQCLSSYYAELDRRMEQGFTTERALPLAAEEMRPPRGVFLLATLRGEPVGCGGLKLHGDGPAEIKRMWVADSTRGLGIGRRLLGALEEHAATAGAPAVRLDTNRSLVEAIRMYHETGYTEIPAFNDEPHAHHWFEKALTH